MRRMKLVDVLRSPGLQRLWPYILANRKRLVLGIACALMATSIDFSNVYLFGQLADGINGAAQQESSVRVQFSPLAAAAPVGNAGSLSDRIPVSMHTSDPAVNLPKADLFRALQQTGGRAQLQLELTPGDISRVQQALQEGAQPDNGLLELSEDQLQTALKVTQESVMVRVQVPEADFRRVLQQAQDKAEERVKHAADLYAELLVLLFLTKGLFSYGQNYFVTGASQRVLLRLRNQVYEHLQRMGLRFFDRRKTGQLMASITADIPQIQSAVGSNVVDAINAPFTIFAGIALAVFYNWRLALLSAVIIPVMSTLIGLATRRMRRATQQMQSALADVSELLEETLACVRVVRAFVTEEPETRRFVQRSENSFRAYMRGVRIQAALRPLIELIGALGITLAIWIGEQEILHHRPVLADPHVFTFGLLLRFIGTLHYVSNGFRALGGLSIGFQQANVAAERVFDLLDEEPDVLNRPGAIELGHIGGQVEFRNVTFSYGDEPVLKDVSFRIAPGEVLAVVGPSGAGKSTIANLIPRFYDVDSGAVVVDEYDVRNVTTESLRRQIGIVPQESVLFGVSIRDNIAYGKPDATEAEIRDAAIAANALEFIENMPEGLDTVVGQRGATLSGGQRQRVAIARAILRDPRILLLDEATSSLDAQSEALVQAALDELMKGRTTVIIAHRLSTVRNADRILVLSAGQVVEQGRHAELLDRGGLYAELYSRQVDSGEKAAVG